MLTEEHMAFIPQREEFQYPQGLDAWLPVSGQQKLSVFILNKVYLQSF